MADHHQGYLAGLSRADRRERAVPFEPVQHENRKVCSDSVEKPYVESVRNQRVAKRSENLQKRRRIA
jgi:hypothetical protein